MRVREVQSFRTGTLSYCRSLNAPTHPSSSEIVPSGLRVRVLQCHWSSIMSPMNQPLWFVSSEKMKPPKCEIHLFFFFFTVNVTFSNLGVTEKQPTVALHLCRWLSKGDYQLIYSSFVWMKYPPEFSQTPFQSHVCSSTNVTPGCHNMPEVIGSLHSSTKNYSFLFLFEYFHVFHILNIKNWQSYIKS